MTTRARRRRGLVLLALALASGGLAASTVQQRVRDVERQVGPLVPVAVAARDLPPDGELGPETVSVRQVPARFAPPDALAGGEAVAGLHTAVAVTAGSYLTAGHVRGGAGGAPAGELRPGQRALELAVAGGGALASAAPGARVDVLVSTEPGGGGGRTTVALEDVELLNLQAGASATVDGLAADPAGGAAEAATAVATLRVTPRQAVYLTAAGSYAREIRLLLRPPGDRGRAGAVSVGAGDL